LAVFIHLVDIERQDYPLSKKVAEMQKKSASKLFYIFKSNKKERRE